MIRYRPFRNSDPPRLLEFWNEVGRGRGFGRLSATDHLERSVFSKPYFDRHGLILAVEGDDRHAPIVGMVHAGFGADDAETGLDRDFGVVPMILVRPEHRRQGTGAELLRRANEYLRGLGATVFYLGSIDQCNPFYLGIYGSSELPGALDSCDAVRPFAAAQDYDETQETRVYRLDLDAMPPLEDHRVPLLRRNIDIGFERQPMPRSWWHACTMGPLYCLRYEMNLNDSDDAVGRVWVWDMDTFGTARGVVTVGLTDVCVEEPFRRKGYGRLLLHSVLRHLHGESARAAEVVTMATNTAACRFYESLGFVQADTGRVFRKRGPT